MICCFTVVRSSRRFSLTSWCKSVFWSFKTLVAILHVGIHIEHEEEEEEVDTSLRGRLLSLVDKVKGLRKKQEEEIPEVEEEPKPSKTVRQSHF